MKHHKSPFRLSWLFVWIPLLVVIGVSGGWLMVHHTSVSATYPTHVNIDVKTDGDLLPGSVYFDASNIWWSIGDARNQMIRLDHETGELITSASVQSFAMGHDRLSENLISYYEYSPKQWWLQQRSGTPGIPFATGGQYVLVDNDYNRVGVIEDERGIDFHELMRLDNGNYIYLIPDIQPLYKDSTLTCLPRCSVLFQSIVEMTPDGNEVWRWNLADHYNRDDFVMDDVLQTGRHMLYDVTHANSLEMTNDGNLLISVRHTDEIIKLNRETGAVIWRLGGIESKHNDFTYINDPLGGISHQHQPVILDNGNLLVFDNGNSRAGDERYSRAVEYKLNETTMEARLVWSYATPEKHFAPNRGSAYRLPDGNTLINFVSRNPGNIIEVDTAGNVVMEITLPENMASYQAVYSEQ